MNVTVIGAGPAGTCAALSALREGAAVSIYDKSQLPRHKVCGEFLSPEAAQLLDELGAWSKCEQDKPAVLNRVFLSLGKRTKSWKLSRPARGLSRYRMDGILLDHAVERGVRFVRQQIKPEPGSVVAYGRHPKTAAGDRLFGFKAHFRGPTDDVMNLFFFEGGYVGVNAVEEGVTNVCGIAHESVLLRHHFDIDEFLQRNYPLRERLAPLTRIMDWLMTGPLVFGPGETPPSTYAAGDSAAFVDPFTGSGMLGAISTGILAGKAAARGTNPAVYRRTWESVLQGQQRSAGFVRAAIDSGWAERVLPAISGRLLFYATRTRRVRV